MIGTSSIFCRQDSLETGQKAPVLLQQQQQLWQAVVVIVVRLVVAYVPEISMRSVCLLVPSIHSRTCVHRIYYHYYKLFFIFYFLEGGEGEVSIL
jgi:hypothetical protein